MIQLYSPAWEESRYLGGGNYSYNSHVLQSLSEAVDRIADKIQNQNTYFQDVTSDVFKLQQRHHDLTEAQDQPLLLLVSNKDSQKFSTYRILSELLDTELKSVESQLESYEQQAKLGTFDVTINQPSSLLTPIE